MSLNKEHPTIHQLAVDCILYGREVKLNEHKLRLIRMVLFDHPATTESLLKSYESKDLPMDMVDIWLEWLIANYIVEMKPDDTFTLTDEFVNLVKEVHPFLTA